MLKDATPIYLIPGMTPGYPVYARLAPLLAGASIVEFIDPLPDEPLTAYAERMAVNFQADSYICGVSFGGILALEISRIVRPKGCIIISSIRHPQQLPPWFRVWCAIGGRNCSRILQLIGGTATIVPSIIRTDSTLRATKLARSAGRWHRWTTGAVIDWSGSTDIQGVAAFHIHGDADTTFPVKYVAPDIVIASGGHALPVSHPNEVAEAIKRFVGTVEQTHVSTD